MAYDKLDTGKTGQVRLDDIASLYDASKNPEVVQGKKSPEEVYFEFMSLWNTQEKDVLVSFNEFNDYFTDVSALIEGDDQFAAMMQNVWRLK